MPQHTVIYPICPHGCGGEKLPADRETRAPERKEKGVRPGNSRLTQKRIKKKSRAVRRKAPLFCNVSGRSSSAVSSVCSGRAFMILRFSFRFRTRTLRP